MKQFLLDRRRFLTKCLGAGGAGLLLGMAGCDDSEVPDDPPEPEPPEFSFSDLPETQNRCMPLEIKWTTNQDEIFELLRYNALDDDWVSIAELDTREEGYTVTHFDLELTSVRFKAVLSSGLEAETDNIELYDCLKFTAPVSNDQYEPGSEITISWKSEEALNFDMNLEHVGQDSLIEIVTEIDESQSSLQWMLPSVPGMYMLYATKADINELLTSPLQIEILGTEISLIRPNEALQIRTDAQVTIEWKAIGGTGFNLYYTNQGSVQKKVIAKDLSIDTSTFEWIVPPFALKGVKITIEDKELPYSDSSPTFDIQGYMSIDLNQYTDTNTIGLPVPISIPDKPILLVRRIDEKELSVISRECTHAGCAVDWVSQSNLFRCPCHGSEFDINGNILIAVEPEQPSLPTFETIYHQEENRLEVFYS